jgi:hypothetical protein
MRTFSIAAAFALAVVGTNAVASDETVPLQLTVFPCAADSAVAPTLSAWTMQQPPSKIPVTPAWQRTGAVWEGSLALARGAYMLSADSPHCHAYSRWMAIPGAQRHLAITINTENVKTIGGSLFDGTIYGYLPTPTATVDVTRAGGSLGEQTRKSVPTDGDTYQISGLYPGRYAVRIAFGKVVATRDVTIGRTFDTLTVRADLSTADAASIVQQQANGSRFVQAPNSQKTNAKSFELGAASANGWTTKPLAPP